MYASGVRSAIVDDRVHYRKRFRSLSLMCRSHFLVLKGCRRPQHLHNLVSKPLNWNPSHHRCQSGCRSWSRRHHHLHRVGVISFLFFSSVSL
ncbi:hypothetical protein Hanom_Chr12g01106021 [Helianthus anomalus]